MTVLIVSAGLCFREVKSFVPFPRRDSKRKNTLTMSPWPHDSFADTPTCTTHIADGALVYFTHWIRSFNQGVFTCWIFEKLECYTPLFFLCATAHHVLHNMSVECLVNLMWPNVSGFYCIWNVAASDASRFRLHKKISQAHIQLKSLIT